MKAIRILTVLFIVLALMLILVLPAAAQATTPGPAPVPAFDTTPDLLSLVAGAVLSLIFSYVPGLNTKFASLTSEAKRGIMALLLLLTAFAIYGLTCGGILQTGLTCDQPGLTRLAYNFFLALISNQSTFTISPPVNAVKILKAG